MARKYFETEEVVIRKKKGWIDVEDEYTQFYKNACRAVVHLKHGRSFTLLTFLFFRSSNSGVFYSGKALLDEFNQLLIEEKVEAVSQRTMDDYLKDLITCKCVVRMYRGAYQLNPYMFWREPVRHRTDLLAEIKQTQQHSQYVLDLADFVTEQSQLIETHQVK